MRIILFTGKAESGKTTAAKMLKERYIENGYRTAVASYAAYVKDTAKLLFDWNGKKDEEGRKLLQWWGTDVVRAKDPDFWAKTLKRLAYVADDNLDVLIIDDCRFLNEIEIWNNYRYVTVIRVERPGHQNALTQEQREHISETALDAYNPTYTIIAADLEGLQEVVNEIPLY